MKALKVLSLASSLSFSTVHSQDAGTALIQAAMTSLPKCALNCMVEAIGESTCQLSDTQCILANRQLNANVETCVKASCTVKESLVARNFSMTAAKAPVRNRTKEVSWAGMGGGVLAAIAVILRVCARLPQLGGQWGLDDWAILVAILPALPLTGLSIMLANDGLGKDMWNVPFDRITHILYIYYFDESFYLSTIALTKISILLFYLRIFPERNFRRAVFLVIGACVCYIIAFIPVTALQCRPVKIAWKRWDKEHHGTCINLNAEGWTSAIINIVLDITTILLPLRQLSKLVMSRRKKIGIMLMFTLGGFVTVISMLRLKWLVQFANTENVTWDYVPVGYWSTVEAHVGIICACLPAIRALQSRLFPSMKHPSNYYNSNGGSPFPSIAKHKGSQFNTGTSSTSMIRSKAREKDFIPLEEIEIGGDGSDHFRQGSDNEVPAYLGRSNTQVTRGSGATEVRYLADGRPNSNRFGPIMVRKEYSINVEESRVRDSGDPRIGPKSFYKT